ncbi:MAG: YeeE/YedE family protein [Victivallales bacterium]|nr:YeeE/YedE family protein [Victivallales bacterium]
MIIKLFTGKWSTYLSGTVIALLFVLMLYVLDSPVGLSDGYLMLSEYCQESFHNRTIREPPFLDWQTGFLGGILIGALAASLLSREWKLRIMPEETGKNFFASAGATVFFGMAGGFLVMLGLQLAGDSFIGQWAAAIQLSTGAWIFFISILFWGIIFTMLMAAKLAKSTPKSEPKTEK